MGKNRPSYTQTRQIPRQRRGRDGRKIRTSACRPPRNGSLDVGPWNTREEGELKLFQPGEGKDPSPPPGEKCL